jgi:uncharacterized SAM-binding protein YcdF (DUF218 family)
VDSYSLSFLFKKTVTAFLLPPGIFLVLFLAGMLFVTKRSRSFLLGLLLLLYMLSIEPTKELLLLPLENRYPVPSWSEVRHVDAIVALGGGALESAPDIDGEGAVSGDSLQRIVAAYRLHVALKKPIIVAGGAVFGKKPEAEIATDVLRRLGIKEQSILAETRSMDTNQNALFAAEICRKRNWNSIVLVTSAFHMKRSLMLFGRFFSTIVPYPTDYKTLRRGYDYWSFLPDASNLADTALAVKEYLGIIYYKLTLKSQ